MWKYVLLSFRPSYSASFAFQCCSLIFKVCLEGSGFGASLLLRRVNMLILVLKL